MRVNCASVACGAGKSRLFSCGWWSARSASEAPVTSVQTLRCSELSRSGDALCTKASTASSSICASVELKLSSEHTNERCRSSECHAVAGMHSAKRIVRARSRWKWLMLASELSVKRLQLKRVKRRSRGCCSAIAATSESIMCTSAVSISRSCGQLASIRSSTERPSLTSATVPSSPRFEAAGSLRAVASVSDRRLARYNRYQRRHTLDTAVAYCTSGMNDRMCSSSSFGRSESSHVELTAASSPGSCSWRVRLCCSESVLSSLDGRLRDPNSIE